MTLDSKQLEAIERACEFSRLGAPGSTFTIFGLAGTGKTTVMSEIAGELRVPVLTLTGKAASVLRAKGVSNAGTIHSFLYGQPEIQLVDDGSQDGVEVMHWHKQHDPGELYGKTVAIDECSMVNTELARHLIEAGVRMIACGDPGQLPPVEGEPYFTQADITLETNHRQGEGSRITKQAWAVREGRGYMADGEEFRVWDREGFDRDYLLSADAHLVWTNHARRDMTKHLRKMLGYGTSYPQTGEPVMCIKGNSMEYGVFNGEVFTLAEPFNEGDHVISVHRGDNRVIRIPGCRFDCMRDARPQKEACPRWLEQWGYYETPMQLAQACAEKFGQPCGDCAIGYWPIGEQCEAKYRNKYLAGLTFDFGYVLTIHKAQGSEFDRVMLWDEMPRDRDERPTWLYTGVTRGKRQVDMIPRHALPSLFWK